MSSESYNTKGSYIWLAIAGSVAVLLSYSLFRVDNVLTYSDKEERLGKTLHELRSAQAEVSSGERDPRQDNLEQGN
ncbi:hypothetical protein MRY87_12230 [bacterium]|nr:hypothetical protein [bacterium]